MTQMIPAIDGRNRHRAEVRQFRVFYVVGFVLYLPFVLLRRLVPRSWRSSRPGETPGGAGSIFRQTKAEVSNLLAYIFMV